MSAAVKEKSKGTVKTEYGPGVLIGFDEAKNLACVGFRPDECTSEELKAQHWRGGAIFFCMIDKQAVTYAGV